MLAAGRALLHTAPYYTVQTFIVTPAARELADGAMAVIDAVHGLGSLSRLIFDRDDLPFGWQGQFDPYSRSITVSSQAKFPRALHFCDF
jgi:hypothetical protein